MLSSLFLLFSLQKNPVRELVLSIPQFYKCKKLGLSEVVGQVHSVCKAKLKRLQAVPILEPHVLIDCF